MKCTHCPVNGPCYAEVHGRHRLCELVAAGRIDYRQRVMELSRDVAAVPADQGVRQRVRLCPHRDCSGCGSARCKWRDGIVTSDECAACPLLPPAATDFDITVIVAGRNCAPFLEEAIRSALNQSHAPSQVIYSDDASLDDSLAIAHGLGVRVIASPAHEGVCAARNRGLAMARSRWVLHLDADDLLPREYLASRAATLAAHPQATFCYGPAQEFGARAVYWQAPEWDVPRLWCDNYINTSTLVRRDALLDAGGWQEGIGTAWDWDLWLRLAQRGYAGVGDVREPLGYRRHSGSISVEQCLHDRANIRRMNYLQRARAARVAICCVYSGRLALSPWLDRVGTCVTHFRREVENTGVFAPFGTSVRPQVDLVFLDTTGWLATQGLPTGPWDSASVITDRWEPSLGEDRADSVSRGLARLYNRFLQLPHEVLWFVEDDIGPPRHALTFLHAELLSGERPIPAASGWYRNRHNPQQLVSAHWPLAPALQSLRYQEAPTSREMVDVAGTGCLLIFRPLAQHGFESHVGSVAAHDWAWCLKLPRGPEGRLPVLAEVGCDHYVDATQAV